MVRSRRRIAVLCCVLALSALSAVAAPAFAVEEEGAPSGQQMPGIDEVGTQSDTAREFFPEVYEPPSVYDYFIWPLLILGVVIVLGVLLLYLLWQPAFAHERRTKRRRR